MYPWTVDDYILKKRFLKEVFIFDTHNERLPLVFETYILY